jgi:heme exporter protein A
LLQASGLARRFGRSVAVRDVDLELLEGERVVLLGPNGSGKTTLIRLLGLVLPPTAGAITVNGTAVRRDTAAAARRAIGLVAHRTGLYEDLTARENLRFYGRLYGVPEIENRVSAVLDDVGLGPHANEPVRVLSRGMQQRAALARAILHEPAVLLMDEPETGLDIAAQEWLGDLCKRWARADRAVLVATHHLEWAAAVADRALVLRENRLVRELVAPGADLPTAYGHTMSGAA